MPEKNHRFLFTCGGTAGHIYPAVGVAGRLKKRFPDAEFLFVGAEGKMETELVPREGYPMETVPITNISRGLSPAAFAHNAKTIKNVLASTGQAKRILQNFQPCIAIGTGGYVCYPVLRAAHALHIPTMVHESNAMPGLTTKMLSRIVDCVMVGFEEAQQNYPKNVRVAYTGTPVREAFVGLEKSACRAALGIDPEKPLILSVWGSLGSDHMNDIMGEMLPIAAAREELTIIHAAGKRGYDRLVEKLQANSSLDYARRGIDVRPYIFDMPQVMAAADLILCRSGASTLSEIQALGRPAILVPSPNVTGNHQEKNARVLERLGAAEVFLEGQFTAESFYEHILALVRDTEKLQAMGAAAGASARKDATGEIVELLLQVLEQKNINI